MLCRIHQIPNSTSSSFVVKFKQRCPLSGELPISCKSTYTLDLKMTIHFAGPYFYAEIDGATVNIGDDGTDDDVKVKVCSDVNDVCCQQKLSHTLRDGWKMNTKEVWIKSDFGECSKILYKARIWQSNFGVYNTVNRANFQLRSNFVCTYRAYLFVNSLGIQYFKLGQEPK